MSQLYSVRVIQDNRQLLQVVGERDTVIEMCLKVMLDAALDWDKVLRYNPAFQLEILKTK